MAIGDVTFYANYINFYGIDYTAEPSASGETYTCSGGETSGELYDLVDNKRGSIVTFDTNGQSTNPIIDFDFSATIYAGCVIIDKHNLKTATADVTLLEASTPKNITTAYSGALGAALTATTISSNEVITGGATGSDGILLINFTSVESGTAFEVTFDDYNAANYSANLWIGEIIFSNAKTMSIAPTINIIDETKQPGVTVNTSLGGQKYSFATSTRRKAWNLTWQIMTSTDKANLETVWIVTGGGRYPFYIDLGEAATPQLYYVRFMQDTLRFTQLSSGAYSTTILIESEV